ncbi:peroxiredoxin [Halorhodospira neutriphila]|uniref:Peroxiredoxin n=1 Tax=Halorhodospira neutriphila TaxID=168379 RepID=A0ABS1E5Q2_9GAMM|nr:peroxiredoxin [Halorhodospira neutriphila]MBK1727005.1 peroxiredoxin [Halorhodospira neutriphila]
MESTTTAPPMMGQKFPEMEVNTTHGTLRLPDAYRGKWLVLFSHPGDFTPVCTTEFVSFQRYYDQFRELGAELLGHSVDQVFSHIKWSEWIGERLDTEIQFPIIADDRGVVADKLGLIHPEKGSNSVRGVFLIDPEGTFRAILYYPQELGRNIEEILRMVRGFQASDQNGVALPANWPNNELINDCGIIPPAADVETARQRPQQYDSFDWWFCYRSI